MKKSPEPRQSHLVPQRPVRKTRLLSRGRSQNSYRRRRFKGESRKAWLRGVAYVFGFLTLAGFCLGLVVLYHQLLTSSLFCIKDMHNIQVEGNKRLSRDVVLHRAGLHPGLNILTLRPDRVEQALRSHPWIAKAEVSREWPHGLLIKIQERYPVALVQIGENLLYMDRQGILFKPLSPGDPHNFPVITGLTLAQFRQPGGGMSEVVAQAFQLMAVLKKTSPPLDLENISEIHADLERGFTLYANGLRVPLDVGFKDFSDKLQKFAQLWPVLIQKGLVAQVGRINLNYPRRVLVTLKGTETNP